MKPTARIPAWTEHERRPVVARAIAPRTPWADLSKTGDNAGVDGAVVLLAAAVESYATGGSSQPPFGCSDQLLHRRIGLAHLGEHRNATVRINRLALSAWRIPTVLAH